MLSNSLKLILQQHSRSFYLSLQILPSALRLPISLAYLLARMADTIADTSLFSREIRQEKLRDFSDALRLLNPAFIEWDDSFLRTFPNAEAQLLRHRQTAIQLFKNLSIQTRISVDNIVQTLIHGMIQNLHDFPGNTRESLASLKNQQHLEEYCYYAAGCVGEFWTAISFQKVPKLRSRSFEQMRAWGKAFGEGLQLINILQDIPRDLDSGRCYLPLEFLNEYGIALKDLEKNANHLKLLLDQLIQEAKRKLAQGIRYVEAIPHGEIRLRLACAWPLLIGLKTLKKLEEASNLISPAQKIKISRQEVYRILLKTLLLFPIPSGSRFCLKV